MSVTEPYVPVVREVVEGYDDRWLSMKIIWEEIRMHHPDIAKKITAHISEYESGQTEAWFLHQVCRVIGNEEGFEFNKSRDHDNIHLNDENGLIRNNKRKAT